MTDERTDLQRKLADARAKLEALPLAHQVKHPDVIRAKRAALEAKVRGLEERLSTAPVHKMVRPVDPTAGTVDDGPCLDGDGSQPLHSSAQVDAQTTTVADLQEQRLSTDSTDAMTTADG